MKNEKKIGIQQVAVVVHDGVRVRLRRVAGGVGLGYVPNQGNSSGTRYPPEGFGDTR